MLGIIQENSELLNVIVSVLMLFVWLFYARLFYMEFSQQRNLVVYIHQAPGHDIDALCLLINLSQGPIHVMGALVAAVHRQQGSIVKPVTDYRHLHDSQKTLSEVENIIHQGPLNAGEMLSLGSFREILLRIHSGGIEGSQDLDSEEWDQHFLEDLEYIEVRIIAMHGTRPIPMGAYRRFRVIADGKPQIQPIMPVTQHMVKPDERRQVQQWLNDCI